MDAVAINSRHGRREIAMLKLLEVHIPTSSEMAERGHGMDAVAINSRHGRREIAA